MKELTLIFGLVCMLSHSAKTQEPQGWPYWEFDSCNFEYAFTVTPLSGVDSLWQIGRPNKNYLTKAHSLPNVIVTDSLMPYPDSVTSFFQLNISMLEHVDQPEYSLVINFDHWMQTDEGFAGGYILFAADDDTIWQNIADIDTLHPFWIGWTDGQGYGSEFSGTLWNGQKAFTGNSNGWKEHELVWIYNYYVGPTGEVEPPDTLRLRFVFAATQNLGFFDGWAIDNILLKYMEMTDLKDMHIQNSCFVFPNPAMNDIYLSTPIEAGNYHYMISGIQGNSLLSGELKLPDQQRISISSLPNGTYILRLLHETNVYSTQFVKTENE